MQFYIKNLITCLIGITIATSSYAIILEDKVIYNIDNNPITEMEKLDYEKTALALTPSLKNKPGYKKEILDSLINHHIILSRFKENNYNIPDTNIDQEIELMAKSSNVDKKTFLDELLKKDVTANMLQQYVKGQFATKIFINSAYKKELAITDKEINKFKQTHRGELSQYQIHDVWLPEALTEKTTPQSVYSAVKNDEGTPVGVEIRKLPMQDLGNLPVIYQKSIQNLAKNDISQPIKTGNGWHILKITEKQSISDDAIRQHVYMNKVNKIIDKAIKSLRSQTVIEHIKY